MAKAYRFKAGQEGIPDEQKVIEEYETIEAVTTFNIEQAEREIDMMNIEITNTTTRRDALQVRVDAAKNALNLE